MAKSVNVELERPLAPPSEPPTSPEPMTDPTIEPSAAQPKTKGHSPRFWAIIVSLSLLAFISALDTMIITTALPAITQDIGGATQYIWIGNSFVLASSVLQDPLRPTRRHPRSQIGKPVYPDAVVRQQYDAPRVCFYRVPGV
ncbi:unnamed protein product [Clonostachys chloroleuca]|uniref:Major facilitator superfamily (MFS) profile domain-containing protein n=1 Tax=Clonostachys chloroleuca TaxID=1926264 RepID=A0AA35Q5H7_9HYPO|nr:unnamed protein product [Clonostachys chloroleuca]